MFVLISSKYLYLFWIQYISFIKEFSILIIVKDQFQTLENEV